MIKFRYKLSWLMLVNIFVEVLTVVFLGKTLTTQIPTLTDFWGAFRKCHYGDAWRSGQLTDRNFDSLFPRTNFDWVGKFTSVPEKG